MNLPRQDEMAKIRRENDDLRQDLLRVQHDAITTVGKRSTYDDLLGDVLKDKRILEAIARAVVERRTVSVR